MVSKKIETEACTICNAKNCTGCCFAPELKNNYEPSDEIRKLVNDGYFNPDDVIEIFKFTQEKRRLSGCSKSYVNRTS